MRLGKQIVLNERFLTLMRKWKKRLPQRLKTLNRTLSAIRLPQSRRKRLNEKSAVVSQQTQKAQPSSQLQVQTKQARLLVSTSSQINRINLNHAVVAAAVAVIVTPKATRPIHLKSTKSPPQTLLRLSQLNKATRRNVRVVTATASKLFAPKKNTLLTIKSLNRNQRRHKALFTPVKLRLNPPHSNKRSSPPLQQQTSLQQQSLNPLNAPRKAQYPKRRQLKR